MLQPISMHTSYIVLCLLREYILLISRSSRPVHTGEALREIVGESQRQDSRSAAT